MFPGATAGPQHARVAAIAVESPLYTAAAVSCRSATQTYRNLRIPHPDLHSTRLRATPLDMWTHSASPAFGPPDQHDERGRTWQQMLQLTQRRVEAANRPSDHEDRIMFAILVHSHDVQVSRLTERLMIIVKPVLLLFVLLFLVPLGIFGPPSTRPRGVGAGWQKADRSSAGLLPSAAQNQDFAGRQCGSLPPRRSIHWRGIFATHCWIVFKIHAGGRKLTRVCDDYTAWGEPLRGMNMALSRMAVGSGMSRRWFSPPTVRAAALLVSKMQAAIMNFAFRGRGRLSGLAR